MLSAAAAPACWVRKDTGRTIISVLLNGQIDGLRVLRTQDCLLEFSVPSFLPAVHFETSILPVKSKFALNNASSAGSSF